MTIRFATEADTPRILQFIRQLADYEHLLDQVTATEDLLADQLFRQKRAEVLLAQEQGQEVGFALFFHNFSTFLSTGERVSEPPSSGFWPPWPRSGAAGVWSGPAWTGTSPASLSTDPWEQSPWRTGPSTVSPGRPWTAWPEMFYR